VTTRTKPPRMRKQCDERYSPRRHSATR
jgi:hypothetical protein